jgi:BirA family biotin operon repressor/biotin-[acetyl-CoA-carboxylase] ligase
MKIHRLASVPSTNRYCEALDLAEVEDFTCYWALAQTAGIGQRGNHWEAEPGKNLTFSLVLHPTFLPADRQFKLTEALSLALCDCLKDTKDLKVKWPNDIYVGKRKICGTLVSTRLQGAQIASAICGIGLNVNQTVFPDWVPNPTSMALLTGEEYDLEPLLKKILACIEKRYNDLKNGIDPEPEYLAHLLNINVTARYIYNEEELTATLTGIDPHGRLLLTTADGRHLSCGMKEITFLV